MERGVGSGETRLEHSVQRPEREKTKFHSKYTQSSGLSGSVRLILPCNLESAERCNATCKHTEDLSKQTLSIPAELVPVPDFGAVVELEELELC